VVDALGVAVFAVSGALAAGRKQLDVLGVVVVAIVTAVGGGTLRDLVLDRPVFWVDDPTPILVILAAAAATILVARRATGRRRGLLVADALGLAFFAVSGAQVARAWGASPGVVIVLGAVTGTAGGMLRDLLLAEIPIVLRRGDLYVTAAVAGIGAYLGLAALGVPDEGAAAAGMALVAAVRLASMRWGFRLPTVRFPPESAG
jgi:uncharacterized membrane protein YeiH